jgi:hypothetical protein
MTDPRDVKREALEQALQEYMAICGDGAYLIDWVVFAAGADPSGAGTQYGFWVSQHTSLHSLRGLIDLGLDEIREGSASITVGEEDDGD